MTKLFVLVVTLTALSSSAYPIPPATIWELTRDADFIVVAHVESTRETDASDVARLRVKETWKGTTPKVLEVVSHSLSVCPAPPRFDKGRDVIAFLSRDDKGRFHVKHLSYGARYFNGAQELAALRELVKTTLALQTESSNAEPSFEWFEQAFKEPVTRWDGVQSASPQSFTRREPRTPLSPRVVEALKQAFIRKPSLDRTAIQIMRTLRDDTSVELTRAFVKSVDGIFAAPETRWSALAAVQEFERRIDTPTETPEDVHVRWVRLKTSLGVR